MNESQSPMQFTPQQPHGKGVKMGESPMFNSENLMQIVRTHIENALAILTGRRNSGGYDNWAGESRPEKQSGDNAVISLSYCSSVFVGAFFLLISVFIPYSLKADILVTEDFAYGDGSDVVGLGNEEGTWTSEWKWNSELTGSDGNVDRASAAIAARQGTSILSVADKDGSVLHIKDAGEAGESVRYFSRNFDKYSGERIFIGFNMRVLEMPDAASSFFLFLHERGQVIPTAYRLNIGVENGVIAARYYHDRHNTVQGQPIESERDYRVVAEFVKSISGEDEYFDTIRFWVNPGPGDYFDPEREFASESLVDIRCRGIDSLGIVMRGPSVGSFQIGNIIVATAWDDLFQGKDHAK